MQGHMTRGGNRVITVEGFSDSIKISKVEKLLHDAAIYSVFFKDNEASRIAGLKLTGKVRTLNAQAEQEKKTCNVFTRFLTLDWRPAAISVEKGLAYCENMFRTYNLEQFQEAFPGIDSTSVQSPLFVRDSEITKINTHTTVMDTTNNRYIDKRTGLVIVDNGEMDAENLRPITAEDCRTGFVVPEELMKMKLNETQAASLRDGEAADAISFVAHSVSSEI